MKQKLQTKKSASESANGDPDQQNRKLTEKVILGKISGVSGIRGWVKIHSETRPREQILNYSHWWIGNKIQWLKVAILGAKPQGKTLVTQLEDVNDRTQAEGLVGYLVAIDKGQLAPLEEGYYWIDLIGLTVINQDDYELGQIVDMMETGANDVMVVEGVAGQGKNMPERLLPYISDVVDEVDLKAGIMRVIWDEGF